MEKTAKSAKPKAQEKVMVVDDEVNICKLVKDVLEEAGYKAMTAPGGKEALAMLKKEKADLILVDFFMPGMSGRELCGKIRADPELKDIKLAFFTVAEFSKDGYRQMKELNIKDYIRKPFDNGNLIERIREMLAGKKLLK